MTPMFFASREQLVPSMTSAWPSNRSRYNPTLGSSEDTQSDIKVASSWLHNAETTIVEVHGVLMLGSGGFCLTR